MNNYYTLTFSETSKGWPSFYSFGPENIRGMNNYLYTFKGGDLWRHNSSAVNRNNFYGSTKPSKIKSVINEKPLENKLFKTIELHGDMAWGVTMTTDLPNSLGGQIVMSEFQQKEGDWFSYIRTENYQAASQDIAASQYAQRSVGGIGNIATIVADPAICADCYVITYDINITNKVSIGDRLYNKNAALQNYNAGEILDVNFTTNTIVLDYNVAAAAVPVVGDYSYYVKSIEAESNGLLGHYLVFELELTMGSATELFAVKSDVMKSYP